MWVVLFTGRQTRWDVLTWDVLTLGRFDFGHFDFGHFHLGRFDSGTFWLWDVLTWDVLTLGRFDLGHFDFGTFWLGTIWLWDILTSVFTKKMCAFSSLVKYSENILGTFWQITWDVLVLGRFDRIPLLGSLEISLNSVFNYTYRELNKLKICCISLNRAHYRR